MALVGAWFFMRTSNITVEEGTNSSRARGAFHPVQTFAFSDTSCPDALLMPLRFRQPYAAPPSCAAFTVPLPSVRSGCLVLTVANGS